MDRWLLIPMYLLASLARVEARYPVLKATGVLREENGSLELGRYTRNGDPVNDARLFIEYINQTDEYLDPRGGKRE